MRCYVYRRQIGLWIGFKNFWNVFCNGVFNCLGTCNLACLIVVRF